MLKSGNPRGARLHGTKPYIAAGETVNFCSSFAPPLFSIHCEPGIAFVVAFCKSLLSALFLWHCVYDVQVHEVTQHWEK